MKISLSHPRQVFLTEFETAIALPPEFTVDECATLLVAPMPLSLSSLLERLSGWPTQANFFYSP